MVCSSHASVDQGLMMNDAVGYAANFDQSMTTLANPFGSS